MGDTIIVEDLIVLTYDLGKMNFNEATMKVKELGDDWRLPTLDEFENMLYPNMGQIPNIKVAEPYWSSTELATNYAWNFFFTNGSAYSNNKLNTFYVRAVKAFNGEAAIELLLKDF